MKYVIAFLVGAFALLQPAHADWRLFAGGGVNFTDDICSDANDLRTGVAGMATRVRTVASCKEDTGYSFFGGVDYVMAPATASGAALLLGVEVGYHSLDGDLAFVETDTGDTSINIVRNSKLENDTIAYGARIGGSFYDNRLRVYARGGYHSWDFELQDIVEYELPRITYDGTDPYYGVGAEFDIYQADRFSVGGRVTWTRYEAKLLGIDTELDVVGLSLIASYDTL